MAYRQQSTTGLGKQNCPRDNAGAPVCNLRLGVDENASVDKSVTADSLSIMGVGAVEYGRSKGRPAVGRRISAVAWLGCLPHAANSTSAFTI